MMGRKDDNRCDVLIAGAGFPGLAMALALHQTLGPTFRVSVVDPAFARPKSNDGRASAIAAAARRLFEALDVWDAVAPEAQPILDMVVTDSRLKDAVRPVFLSFAGEVEPGEPFAHMVENKILTNALVAKARAAKIELRPSAVANVEHVGDEVVASLVDGSAIRTGLLIAADGARSRIREIAGIASVSWSYGQSGIVTTVGHERDHHGRAEEHFLAAGPFAMLPLKGQRSSIVWTEASAEADRLVALPDKDFQIELERRFGLHLGEVQVVGARRAYPLGLAIARSFIAERIALIGDAAHVIHPIAGQGLNMGLRDVAALAESIVDAARLGYDVGHPDVLDRYQEWRRFDTVTMGIVTDALNRLFSNRSDALRVMRDLGLGIVDRIPPLKQLFIREAAGLTGDVPKLLRGEAL